MVTKRLLNIRLCFHLELEKRLAKVGAIHIEDSVEDDDAHDDDVRGKNPYNKSRIRNNGAAYSDSDDEDSDN